MPGRKEEKKQGRDDSRGEHGDITRASASSPPLPERRAGRGGLPARFTYHQGLSKSGNERLKEQAAARLGAGHLGLWRWFQVRFWFALQVLGWFKCCTSLNHPINSPFSFSAVRPWSSGVIQI